MQRGDRVIVRAYGDQALARRVWEFTDHSVAMYDERNYQLRCKELACAWPVWLRRTDVFLYDSEVLRRLDAGTATWAEATPA